jgi:hypothetical protein
MMAVNPNLYQVVIATIVSLLRLFGNGDSVSREEHNRLRRMAEASAKEKADLERRIQESKKAMEKSNEELKKQAQIQYEEHRRQLEQASRREAETRQALQTQENAVRELTAQLERINRANQVVQEQKREIVRFINNRGIRVTYLENKWALVGPKGSGKSTFLWLMGISDKPMATFDDGTVSLSDHHNFVDTIGVDINTESLLRMLVLFIIRGVPDKIILFGNDRTLSEGNIALLNLLSISNFLFCSLNIEYIFGGVDTDDETNEDQPREVKNMYNRRVYRQLRRSGLGVTPITHEDDITAIGGRSQMRILRNMFPNDRIEITEDEINNQSGDILVSYKVYIIKLIYEFYNKYSGDELRFINSARTVTGSR